jgi:hypothetical protein
MYYASVAVDEARCALARAQAALKDQPDDLDIRIANVVASAVASM